MGCPPATRSHPRPPLARAEAVAEDMGGVMTSYDRTHWMPDDAVDACMLCESEFSFWKRRVCLPVGVVVVLGCGAVVLCDLHTRFFLSCLVDRA